MNAKRFLASSEAEHLDFWQKARARPLGGSSTGIAPSAAKAALERTKWQKGRESIIIHIINWGRKERRAPYLGIFRASL